MGDLLAGSLISSRIDLLDGLNEIAWHLGLVDLVPWELSGGSEDIRSSTLADVAAFVRCWAQCWSFFCFRGPSQSATWLRTKKRWPLDLHGSISQADPEPNGHADTDILLRSDTCTYSAVKIIQGSTRHARHRSAGRSHQNTTPTYSRSMSSSTVIACCANRLLRYWC
jgi:hypothetical protein